MLRLNLAMLLLGATVAIAAVLAVRWAGAHGGGRSRGERLPYPHYGAVEGTRFVLVDSVGAERAKLEMDEAGTVQLWLGSEDRDRPGIGMGLLPDGGPQFILKGKTGGVRALLMANGLMFFSDDSTDHTGHTGPPPIAVFPYQWRSGGSSMMLTDSSGHPVYFPPLRASR